MKGGRSAFQGTGPALGWKLRKARRCLGEESTGTHRVLVPGSRIGGAVASVLATGPIGRGFEPGQGNGYLRAIKIGRTPFFGWEVKPKVPCHKILLRAKNLVEVARRLVD
jgi:hypothetical protein